MKTHTVKDSALGLILVAFLVASPGIALAQAVAAPASPPVKTATIPAPNVSGKVDSRSDRTLTVAGRTVSISSSTTFSKGGTSIGNADIKVGDKVNIVTTNDGQVAVSVSTPE